MNRIIAKEQFSEKVFKFEVEAPLIAKSRKAGHFVIVRVGEKGERMPLDHSRRRPGERDNHARGAESRTVIDTALRTQCGR